MSNLLISRNKRSLNNKIIIILNLEGIIDEKTVKKIDEEIEKLLEQGIKELILDLSMVTYVSSRGMTLLIKFADKFCAIQGSINLVNTPDNVSHLFELLGLWELYKNYQSIDDIIKQMKENEKFEPILEEYISQDENYKKINQWEKVEHLFEILKYQNLKNTLVLDISDIPSLSSEQWGKLVNFQSKLKGKLRVILAKNTYEIGDKLEVNEYLNACIDYFPIEYQIIYFSLQNFRIKEVLKVKDISWDVGRSLSNDIKLSANDLTIHRKQGTLKYLDEENFIFFPDGKTKIDNIKINFNSSNIEFNEIQLPLYTYISFGEEEDTLAVVPKVSFKFKQQKLPDTGLKKYQLLKLKNFYKQLEKAKCHYDKWANLHNNMDKIRGLIQKNTSQGKEKDDANILELIILSIVKYFGNLSFIFLSNNNIEKYRIQRKGIMIPSDEIFNEAKKKQYCYRWNENNIHKLLILFNNGKGVLYLETDEKEWKKDGCLILDNISNFTYSIIYFLNKLYNSLQLLKNNEAHKELNSLIEVGKKCQQYFWKPYIKLDNFKCYTKIKQYNKLGGDFAYSWNTESQYYIAFGDIEGHGIGAALESSYLIGTLASHFVFNEHSLEDIVSRSNSIFRALPETRTAQFILLNLKNNSDKIYYCNAGFNSPLIYNHFRKTVKKLKLKQGPIFGINKQYESSEIILEQSEIIMFYTDGIIESRNAEGKEFGEKRLKTIFKKACNQEVLELDRISNTIIKEVENFACENLDDMSILLILKDDDISLSSKAQVTKQLAVTN